MNRDTTRRLPRYRVLALLAVQLLTTGLVGLAGQPARLRNRDRGEIVSTAILIGLLAAVAIAAGAIILAIVNRHLNAIQ